MKVPAPVVQLASAMVIVAAGAALFQGGGVRAQVQNPAPPTLSAQEQNGEMLFFQRCSLCHLPPLVGPGQAARLPFGPLLYGFMDNPRNAARVHAVIRTGGPQMPGFQYGLSASEIEDVVAFMKTPGMKAAPQWYLEARKSGRGAGDQGNPVD